MGQQASDAITHSAGDAAEEHNNWRGRLYAIVTRCECERWLGEGQATQLICVGLPGRFAGWIASGRD